MKVKIGQFAICGPHTDQIGRVSAIRKDGFYARFTSIHPRVPGARTGRDGEHPKFSRFFRFSEIGPDGYNGHGVTVQD